MSEISEKEIEALVNGMCLTYRHDFGLLSEQEREGTRRVMRQIFQHNIAPFIAAHARAEAVGVKDASYTEMLIDNAACASQCDFDAVTREAIRLNIIDPLLALAHPAVPEWQPIETAPKNEEILIAYWRWRNSMSPGSVVVQSAQMTEFHGEGIWSWVVSDNKHGPFPIRGWSDGDILGWMPLPKPPVAAAEKEARG